MSKGVIHLVLETMRSLADYWATEYDWRPVEARLQALAPVRDRDRRRRHPLHLHHRHPPTSVGARRRRRDRDRRRAVPLRAAVDGETESVSEADAVVMTSGFSRSATIESRMSFQSTSCWPEWSRHYGRTAFFAAQSFRSSVHVRAARLSRNCAATAERDQPSSHRVQVRSPTTTGQVERFHQSMSDDMTSEVSMKQRGGRSASESHLSVEYVRTLTTPDLESLDKRG